MQEEQAPATIMIVDDSVENLSVLDKLLTSKGYRVVPFARGETALRAAAKTPPDLFLLDINMPGLNGFQVCEALKANHALAEIPVLFISGEQESEAKVTAFKVGALDYITKPFWFEEVDARVRTHLRLRRLQQRLEDHNVRLEELVAEQVKEISDAQMATILALAKLAESRDDDTGGHIDRVRSYCRVLAEAYREIAGPDAGIDSHFVANIFHASPLHDIGKVGVPDSVLLKPGKLTAEEFEIIKTHSTIGAETLAAVNSAYPRNALIQMGLNIARHHHEKWDGSGYPDGLRGEAIPLSARIVALADVYEALRSQRPYRGPLSHQETREIIVADRGKHFDPTAVAAFEAREPEFEKTSNELAC